MSAFFDVLLTLVVAYLSFLTSTSRLFDCRSDLRRSPPPQRHQDPNLPALTNNTIHPEMPHRTSEDPVRHFT